MSRATAARPWCILIGVPGLLKPVASRFSWALPCLIGVAGFLLVVGPSVLDPANVGWLRRGDAMTHYLGWSFFRHAPWTIPPGLNPNYGLELSSSILYTDSIPLLALLFKPLSPWLPEPFQYSGMWLLACFILQGWFAWVLIGLVTPRPALRLAGCALFVFAPPMLFRLAGHWALASQWIVIAALVLAFRPSRRHQSASWTLLVVVATLVHTYLFVMAAAIWISSWAADLWAGRRRFIVLALEALAVPASVLTALWLAGFFAVGEGKSMGGFGYYRLNLVSPINSLGWSYVLPAFQWQLGDYEGFAYFGLGGLLAALVALHAAGRLRARGELTFRREWLPLGLVLLGLTVFAVSNKVGIGMQDYTYPLPQWLVLKFGMLRASGRLFWPAFYVVLFAVTALIIRAYPARVSLGILVAATAVQVVDTSAGWRRASITHGRQRTAIRSPLTSGFWFDAPTIYRRVRLVPPGNFLPNWDVISDYAARQGLATDAIYAARVDQDRATALLNETMTRLADGTFDSRTFYILQGGTARQVPCALTPGRDQLALVDGFWVLMPEWKARFGDRYAGEVRLGCPLLEAQGAPLTFTSGAESQAALASGWSSPEAWGTWSVGPRSTINLHLRGPASALEFSAGPFIRPGPPLRVDVSLNGRPATTWEIAPDPEPRNYRLALPPDQRSDKERRVQVSFAYSDTRSPSSLGQSGDSRQIALALLQVRAVR